MLLRTPARIWAVIGQLGTQIWAARYRHKKVLVPRRRYSFERYSNSNVRIWIIKNVVIRKQ